MKDFLIVTSRENALIKQIIALQTSAKARKESGLYVLEGLRICSDAAENGEKFEKLIVSDSAVGKYAESINIFSDCAVQCVRIPDSLFKKISDTDSPQGILTLVKIPDICSTPIKSGRYIGLENLADPSNLGAISRTAEALGVSGIVLTQGSCDPFSPKALRASMGTLLRVPLYFTDDICKTAKEVGLRTIACVVDSDAEKISDIDFCDGDILLIGNEANGLTDVTKSFSDRRVTIPMKGNAESLNAAAAAAIAMWEMVR